MPKHRTREEIEEGYKKKVKGDKSVHFGIFDVLETILEVLLDIRDKMK